MTLTDKKMAELRSKDSNSVRTFVTASSIAAALLAVSPAIEAKEITSPGYLTHAGIHESSFSVVDVRQEMTGVDLFLTFNDIYDELLANAIDLDPESKDILYSNLWDLYE